MSDFAYEARVLRRMAAEMEQERDYAHGGGQEADRYIHGVPTTAGSDVFADSVAVVRDTGRTLTQLHRDIANFWKNSAVEMEQTVARYEATDEQAAADADALYHEYELDPVEEERRQ